LLLDDTGEVVDEVKGPDSIGACPRLETTAVAPRLLPPSRTVEEDRGSERSWDWRTPLLLLVGIALIGASALAVGLMVVYVFGRPIWSCPDCKAKVRLTESRCGNCGMEAPGIMRCLAPAALLVVAALAVLIAWLAGGSFDSDYYQDGPEGTHQTSEHTGQQVPKPPG
jgi:hypothetical protein